MNCDNYYQHSPQASAHSALEDADRVYWRTYGDMTQGMNRAERRTAQGRMIVLEAKEKSLIDKIEALQESLERGFW